MDPITTYQEVRFDGKRTLRLFSDRILVQGSTVLGYSSFESTIALKVLSLTPDRLSVRSPHFNGGLWMVIISPVIGMVLVSGLGMGFDSPMVVLMGVMCLSGLLFLWSTWKRVEYARFTNDVGIVILDIAVNAKEPQIFTDFIGMLTQQIATCRSQGKSSPADVHTP